MSLTTRQRTSIFQTLVPVLGEEDADALVAQLPAAERDVLVTREHLRAEFAEFRAELAAIRTDMHAHLNKTMGAMTGILLAAMGVLAALT